MEWISVEERLPESEYVVLGWHKNWHIELCHVRNGFSYMQIGLCDDKATHWMPLPEPPKE